MSDPVVAVVVARPVVTVVTGVPGPPGPGGGGGGSSVHGDLTGRDAADSHPQSAVTGLVAALAAKQAADPTLDALAALDSTTGLLEQTGADTFVRRAIGVGASTSVPTRADADTRYAAAAAPAAAVTAHEAAGDPHPQYTTAAEAASAASSAVSTHSGATDPHGDRAYADAALATKLDDVAAGTDAEIVGANAAGTALQRLGHTIATLLAAAWARANHTGTQFASTISDFASAALAAVTWSTLTGKPSVFPPDTHTHPASEVTSGTFDPARLPAATTSAQGAVELATVAEVEAGSDTSRAVTPQGYRTATPPYVEWGASADKTLAASDANVDQWCNNSSTARVLNIPTNASVAFATGTKIPILRLGSGTCTVDAAVGVTLNGVSGGSCTVSTQYQGALLTKSGTDAWVISGDHGTVA